MTAIRQNFSFCLCWKG